MSLGGTSANGAAGFMRPESDLLCLGQELPAGHLLDAMPTSLPELKAENGDSDVREVMGNDFEVLAFINVATADFCACCCWTLHQLAALVSKH